MIDPLEPGDVLMVTRLDRLARSTRDLLNTLAAITDQKAGFRSLSDTWADTTTSHGRLMLTVLGGLAEFERDLIRARTGEGRARAVARGVKMGRPPKLTPHQQKEAIKRRDQGEETLADIGRSYNVSAATISRLRMKKDCRIGSELVILKTRQVSEFGKSFPTNDEVYAPTQRHGQNRERSAGTHRVYAAVHSLIRHCRQYSDGNVLRRPTALAKCKWPMPWRFFSRTGHLSPDLPKEMRQGLCFGLKHRRLAMSG